MNMSDSTVPRLPLSPEVAAIAHRVVWFETPQQAIENSARFMAYVMTTALSRTLQCSAAIGRMKSCELHWIRALLAFLTTAPGRIGMPS